MRYFHSGFGDQDPGILGDSDSEDDVEMTTAQADTIAGANVIGASTTKKGKRKHEDGEGSAKRAKKHKTAEEIRRKEEKKERKRKEKAKSVS